MALNQDDIAWLERLPMGQLLGVLASPGALQEVLEWAIAHKSWAIRMTACDNKNLPETLILQHYKHFGWGELIIFVNKEKVPLEVLEYISVIPPDIRPHSREYDWNKELRDIARKRLGLSKESENTEGK